MAGESAEIGARLGTLPADEWRVFHDIPWPGRRYAHIDHVVVGPPGAFVIDSKDWSGPVSADDGVLRLNGRRRDTATLAASEAAASIKRLVVAIQDFPVLPVLCFTGDRAVFGRAGDALLCSTDNLATVLTSRPGVVARAVREDVARQLAEKLADANSVRNVVPARPLRIFLPDPSRISAPPPRAPSRSRKADIASVIAGVALALGSLALLTTDSDALGNFGRAFVDLVSNSDDNKPARQPVIQMPTDYPPAGQQHE